MSKDLLSPNRSISANVRTQNKATKIHKLYCKTQRRFAQDVQKQRLVLNIL